MKSLLEFKQESVIVEKPKEEWNKLYLELLELFKSWGLEDRVNSFKYEYRGLGGSFNKNFERSFITKLIIHVLDINRDSRLWDGIFSIEKTSSVPKSYHGSGSNITVNTYSFELRDKPEVLDYLPGGWVYEHLEEVKDFMDQYNKKYMRLFEIKRLFPLEVEFEEDV